MNRSTNHITVDVWKDGIGHMPTWDNKQSCCGFCKDNEFPNAMYGSVSNKERSWHSDYHE